MRAVQTAQLRRKERRNNLYTLCLTLPGVPPRNAILITMQGAFEDIRTIQKDVGGSSGLSLKYIVKERSILILLIL